MKDYYRLLSQTCPRSTVVFSTCWVFHPLQMFPIFGGYKSVTEARESFPNFMPLSTSHADCLVSFSIKFFLFGNAFSRDFAGPLRSFPGLSPEDLILLEPATTKRKLTY